MIAALLLAGAALWVLGLAIAPTFTLVACGFAAACGVAAGWAMHRYPNRRRP